MTVHLGIDTGGTFTDFVRVDAGSVRVEKLPSTPDDPARAIVQALRGHSTPPAFLVHGTTVATNTLLQRCGARTALITTRGFRDVIEIGRQDRPSLYDLRWHPPAPLVPPELRFEVEERVGAGGTSIRMPDPEELGRLVSEVTAARPESVAVCLLFSPENAAHEDAVVEALEPLGVPVVPSSRVHGELREYERSSTAVISAYVAPAIDGYLQRIQEALGASKLLVMESSGGVRPWALLRGHAVRTVLSGPAGGVVGVSTLRRGSEPLVAFDMGGTSTDVALLRDEDIPRTRAFRIDGLPVATPTVDVHTVGAGGGSEAWIDPGGALRVGPRSAGADPGPVCYGRGGRAITVTDANVFLGRLPRTVRLAGHMQLAVDSLDAAVAKLGDSLGLPAVDAAFGVLRIVEAEMERALRKITQERGADPRGLVLVPFGGAAGLHAVSLARALGMRQVRVPRDPGTFSARGMLQAPIRHDATRAVMRPLTAGLLADLPRALGAIEASLRSSLAEWGDPRVERELAVRQIGQSHEIRVPWGEVSPAELFAREVEARFGMQLPGDARLEITAVTTWAEVMSPVRFPAPVLGPTGGTSGGRSTTPVFVTPQRRIPVPLLQRDSLEPGSPLHGPAIVEELSSTTWIPEGATATVAPDGSLDIAVGREAHGSC